MNPPLPHTPPLPSRSAHLGVGSGVSRDLRSVIDQNIGQWPRVPHEWTSIALTTRARSTKCKQWWRNMPTALGIYEGRSISPEPYSIKQKPLVLATTNFTCIKKNLLLTKMQTLVSFGWLLFDIGTIERDILWLSAPTSVKSTCKQFWWELSHPCSACNFHGFIVVKFRNESQIWWSKSTFDQVEGFLRRAQKFGYYDKNEPDAKMMCQKADTCLFNQIVNNPMHSLFDLLPPLRIRLESDQITLIWRERMIEIL